MLGFAKICYYFDIILIGISKPPAHTADPRIALLLIVTDLSRSWAALGPLLAALGLLLAALGPLLGRSWAVHGRSWAALGRSWGGLGLVLAALGRTWAPKTDQDCPERPQERPDTAHRGPENAPRQRTQASQLHNGPSIENAKEKRKKNMLSVNFTIDHPSTI